MHEINISVQCWEKFEKLLPRYPRHGKGGRPRLNMKLVLEGILFVKLNQLPWIAMPKKFGSKTAINDYFRYWRDKKIFHRLEKVITINDPIDIGITLDLINLDCY